MGAIDSLVSQSELQSSCIGFRNVTVRELGEVGCGDLDVSQATEGRLEKCPAKWVVSKEVYAREPRQIDLGASGNSSSKDVDSLAFVLQMGLQAAYVSASFGGR